MSKLEEIKARFQPTVRQMRHDGNIVLVGEFLVTDYNALIARVERLESLLTEALPHIDPADHFHEPGKRRVRKLHNDIRAALSEEQGHD